MGWETLNWTKKARVGDEVGSPGRRLQCSNLQPPRMKTRVRMTAMLMGEDSMTSVDVVVVPSPSALVLLIVDGGVPKQAEDLYPRMYSLGNWIYYTDPQLPLLSCLSALPHFPPAWAPDAPTTNNSPAPPLSSSHPRTGPESGGWQHNLPSASASFPGYLPVGAGLPSQALSLSANMTMSLLFCSTWAASLQSSAVRPGASAPTPQPYSPS